MNRKIKIGRDPRSDIRVEERFDTVSNDHAEIFLDGDRLIFIDHSSNGTIINNQKVKGFQVTIYPGDNISLAGVYPLAWSEIDAFFPPTRRPTVTRNIHAESARRGPSGDRRPGGASQPSGHPGGREAEPYHPGPSGRAAESPGRPPSGRTGEPYNRPPAGRATEPYNRGGQSGRATEQYNRPPSGRATEPYRPASQPTDPCRESRLPPFAGSQVDQAFEQGGRESSQQALDAALGRWNWGAFLLGWLWAVCHRCYWPLIVFVLGFVNAFIAVALPAAGAVGNLLIGLFSLGISIYLGLKGSRIAWDMGCYDSLQHFEDKERSWRNAAFIVVGVSIILALIGIFAMLQAVRH